jgi:hypothetical protein
VLHTTNKLHLGSPHSRAMTPRGVVGSLARGDTPQKRRGAASDAPSGAVPMPTGTTSIVRRRVRVVGRSMRESLADETGILADEAFDPGRHILVRLKEILGILAALADAVAVE